MLPGAEMHMRLDDRLGIAAVTYALFFVKLGPALAVLSGPGVRHVDRLAMAVQQISCRLDRQERLASPTVGRSSRGILPREISAPPLVKLPVTAVYRAAKVRGRSPSVPESLLYSWRWSGRDSSNESIGRGWPGFAASRPLLA